jgi:Zn-dependent protease
MLKGAMKSKTVWWNVLLAVLGGLELIGGHMTVLWGQEVAAAILMVGAMANLVLRTVTTQALSEK